MLRSYSYWLLAIVALAGLSACETPADENAQANPTAPMAQAPAADSKLPGAQEEADGDASQTPKPEDADASVQPRSNYYSAPPCDEVEGLSDASNRREGKPHPNFERFRNEVKRLGELEEKEVDRTRWSVSEKHKDACARWTGTKLPEPGNWPIEGNCAIEFQLDGDAAVIAQTTECGGDDCSVRHFLWDNIEPKAIQLEVHADPGLNVAPSRDVVVLSRMVVPPMAQRTFRLNVTTDQWCVITNECFSPRLAPDGHTIVCRNRDSDVLAVPITGGEPRVLEPAKLPPKHTTYYRAQWGVWPKPVKFVKADRVEYTIDIEESPPPGDSERVERTMDWPPQ